MFSAPKPDESTTDNRHPMITKAHLEPICLRSPETYRLKVSYCNHRMSGELKTIIPDKQKIKFENFKPVTL